MRRPMRTRTGLTRPAKVAGASVAAVTCGNLVVWSVTPSGVDGAVDLVSVGYLKPRRRPRSTAVLWPDGLSLPPCDWIVGAQAVENEGREAIGSGRVGTLTLSGEGGQDNRLHICGVHVGPHHVGALGPFQ